MKLDVMKIVLILAEQGMTKAELAARSGVSRQQISTIIGRGTCSPKTAGKLAAGLGISVGEIMEEVLHPWQALWSDAGSGGQAAGHWNLCAEV